MEHNLKKNAAKFRRSSKQSNTDITKIEYSIPGINNFQNIITIEASKLNF